MRVYISSHDVDLAKRLAADLSAEGYAIVSTWHDGEPAGPAKTDADGWRPKVALNFAEIDNSHVLVLIGGTDKYPGGKYVEAGRASAQGVDVYNLGDVGNGMMHFATHCPTLGDLIVALRNW